MGIYGAALGSATGTAVWNLACLFYIKKKYGRTIAYLPFFFKGKGVIQ
jgi:Na+-driven multidrug efflux pump